MTLALAILIALLVGVCVGVGGTLWFVAKEADTDEERVLIGHTGGGNGKAHHLQVWAERNGGRWWL